MGRTGRGGTMEWERGEGGGGVIYTAIRNTDEAVYGYASGHDGSITGHKGQGTHTILSGIHSDQRSFWCHCVLIVSSEAVAFFLGFPHCALVICFALTECLASAAVSPGGG